MAKGGHKKSHTSKTETKKQPEVIENKKNVTIDDADEDMNSGFGEYMRSTEGNNLTFFFDFSFISYIYW